MAGTGEWYALVYLAQIKCILERYFKVAQASGPVSGHDQTKKIVAIDLPKNVYNLWLEIVKNYK